MTYLAPAATPSAFSIYLRSVLPAHAKRLVRKSNIHDEDTARRALGTDPTLPAAVVAGASLERLARITLG